MVGNRVFVDGLAGFKASGATNEEASAQVIAQCQSAGGQECTSDEVTNDNLCIVSVGDDSKEIVAGGAGLTSKWPVTMRSSGRRPTVRPRSRPPPLSYPIVTDG